MGQQHRTLLRMLGTTVAIAALACISLDAQEECKFGSPEAADALIKALQAEKTCGGATAKLHECQWGSSADTQFAPIVVEKCESKFLNKLSSEQRDRYGTEMQLCAYEYARQDGTMAMSAAAMCQVDVAARFAANPSNADREMLAASRDCRNVQSPIGKAICSNLMLRHADLVLSRVYSRVLTSLKPDESQALKSDQQDWRQKIAGKCDLAGPPFSARALGCTRNEFEVRFTNLDECQDGENDIVACLKSSGNAGNEQPEADASGASPRASFDCEAPATALEIAICADAELGKADIQLAEAYHQADAMMGASQHRSVVASERRWLQFVTASCPLGAIGGIPSVLGRACVRSAFEARIKQLEACPRKPLDGQTLCLNQFEIFGKNTIAP